MAYRFTNAVWEAELKPPAFKLLMLRLADQANDKSGLCWPGIQLLAAAAGIDRRQVQRYLRKAEQAGLIVVLAGTERGGRPWQTKRIRVRIEGFDSLPRANVGPADVDARDGVSAAPEARQQASAPHARGDIQGPRGGAQGTEGWCGDHPNRIEPFKEPSLCAHDSASSSGTCTPPSTNTGVDGGGKAKPRAITPAEAREINRLHLATDVEGTRRRLQEEADRTKRIAADPAAAAARELVRERFKHIKRAV